MGTPPQKRSRKSAAREAVLARARRGIEARLGVRDAELDSLVGVMRSQLDVSLLRLLEHRER